MSTIYNVSLNSTAQLSKLDVGTRNPNVYNVRLNSNAHVSGLDPWDLLPGRKLPKRSAPIA